MSSIKRTQAGPCFPHFPLIHALNLHELQKGSVIRVLDPGMHDKYAPVISRDTGKCYGLSDSTFLVDADSPDGISSQVFTFSFDIQML